MKKLTLILTACVGLGQLAFAGHEVVSSKEYKPVVPSTCFADHELQIDVFAQYSVGEGPHQVGLFRDHGWGGGVGLNYFFTRNLGVGVDAAWLYAKSGDAGSDDHRTTIHNFSGSLIFRIPLDELCLAPYIYAGGGLHVDGEDWASAHVGAGLEYRIVPNKVGIFLDGRWTYLGDRFEHGDLNFFSARAGVRWIF